MRNVKKKKKWERQKEKNQFFLSNGGLGDWWSMSFGLFHLHWKYFIRLTHTRFFWHEDTKKNQFLLKQLLDIKIYTKRNNNLKNFSISRGLGDWWPIHLLVYFIRSGNWIEIRCNTYEWLGLKFVKKKKNLLISTII